MSTSARAAAPEPSSQPSSQPASAAATWPEWARAWNELLKSEGRDTETRMSEPYRFTRAIIAAHPDWGNKYIGRALGYGEETCKNRGAYWRGRLAALGDLPPGVAFSVQRLPQDLRELMQRDPDAAQRQASRNARKLPPMPRALLEELQAIDNPEELYRILRKRRRALEEAHTSLDQRVYAVAEQARAHLERGIQRGIQRGTQGGTQRGAADPEEQPEGWGTFWLLGAAILGGLGAVALLARSEGQRLAREVGELGQG